MSVETALRIQLARVDEENEKLRSKVAALESMYAANPESVKTLCNRNRSRRLKRKLELFGMSVENMWGVGYSLKGQTES